MAITIVIFEDNDSLRQSLVYLLKNTGEYEIVGEYDNCIEAANIARVYRPDVVLMDIGLPGMSGIECIRKLKHLLPDAQIMMLTVFDDHDRIFESLKAGAAGYLIKKTAPEHLLRSISDLYAGGSPMSSQIARRVVEEFQRPPKRSDAAAQLTTREQEVLAKLAQGFLYKEIASAIGVSLETVRTHVRNIYSKLEVRSKIEALNKAFPKKGR